MSHLSPGACDPLWGRAALQVTPDPGGGTSLFGAVGLRQVVPALSALTQDNTVPVARTAAGRTLQTEGEIRTEPKITQRRGRAGVSTVKSTATMFKPDSREQYV